MEGPLDEEDLKQIEDDHATSLKIQQRAWEQENEALQARLLDQAEMQAELAGMRVRMAELDVAEAQRIAEEVRMRDFRKPRRAPQAETPAPLPETGDVPRTAVARESLRRTLDPATLQPLTLAEPALRFIGEIVEVE